MKQLKSLNISYLFSMLIALVVGVLPACKDNDDAYEPAYYKMTPEMKDNSLEVKSEGGTFSINLETNRSWTIDTSEDWISVDPKKGNDGNATITIKVLKNLYAKREGQIRLVFGAINKTIKVIQKGEGNEVVVPAGDLKLADFIKKYDKDQTQAEATAIAEDVKLVVTVISDNTAKQFYPPYLAYVQDGSDKGIIISIPKGKSVKVGDVLEVKLKGAKYGFYVDKNGTKKDKQLSLDKNLTDAVKVIANKPAEPKVLTLEEVYSHKYENILVKVEHLQFQKAEGAFNDSKIPFFRVEDCKTKAPEGNADLSVMVKVGQYPATFATKPIPTKNGSITGILTTSQQEGKPRYWNLVVRTMADFNMTEERCDGGGETPNPNPEPEPENPAEGTVFLETFGTPVKGSYWPSVDKYDGWVIKTNKYSDPFFDGKYSKASARKTSSLDGHIWFASKKKSALKIEGFKTGKGLKLSFKLADNTGTLMANALKLSTDQGVIALPATQLKKNEYQEFTVTLPDNAKFIQFEVDNLEDGVRLDDVKLISGDATGGGNTGGGNTGEEPEPADKAKEVTLANFLQTHQEETMIESNVFFKATVISDMVGNNSASNKNVVVQSGDVALTLRLASAGKFAKNTVLQIYPRWAKLGRYKGGSLQLDYTGVTNAETFVIDTKETAEVTPKVVTLQDIYDNKCENLLVTVEHVQFVNTDGELNPTPGKNGKHAFHPISDCKTMMPENTASVSVAVYKYAKFAGEAKSDKNGSVTGIVSKSKSSKGTTYWNIVIRNAGDINFTDARCTEGGTEPELKEKALLEIPSVEHATVKFMQEGQEVTEVDAGTEVSVALTIEDGYECTLLMANGQDITASKKFTTMEGQNKLEVKIAPKAPSGGVEAGKPMILTYVEPNSGFGSDKYIELYNPTDKEIDLSAYTLQMMANYNGPETEAKVLKLEGKIAPKGIFIISKTGAEILPKAQINQTDNTVINFNGDDSIALFEGDTMIDIIGTWTAKLDKKIGANQILRRKANINKPSATFNLDEWDQTKLPKKDAQKPLIIEALKGR